jgi:4-amino-4-deoxy-L-arabinose transferase-like glycosyltransferase
MELLSEEPRRAVVALEMSLSGNYLVPRINGVDYYNKPPLFNWIIAAFYRLTGSYQEWVVRLPSLLALLLTVTFNFFVIRRYINTQVAILAGLFTLTAADIYFFGAVYSGDIDLFFTLVTYLQIISIFWFRQQKRFLFLFMFSYLFMVIGFLTKGLPSVAFQALTLLGIAIIYKKWRWLFSWKHLAGSMLFLMTVGIYYFLYSREADPFKYLLNLVKEASQRTGIESSFSGFLIGLIRFPLDLIKLTLPWSLLVIFMFRKGVRTLLFSNELTRFTLVFLLFNIPVYWLTGELRSRYIYMFVPFIMILVSYSYLSLKDSMPVTNRWFERFLGVVMALLPFVFLLPPFIQETKDLPMVWIGSAVLFLASLTGTYLYLFKLKGDRIFLLVTAVVLIRIGMNVFYLPAYMKHDPYVYFEKEAVKIVSITGNEPIRVTGIPVHYAQKLALGEVKFRTLEFSYPQMVPFHLTYYLSRLNEHILSFDAEPVPGPFYIGQEDFFKDKKIQEYYRYYDKRSKTNLLLVKILP